MKLYFLSLFATVFAEFPAEGTSGGSGGHVTEMSKERAAQMLRSGLAPAALSDGASEQDDCERVCEEDVLADDVCIGTLTNPVPNGEVWMFSQDSWSWGCCAFGRGACKVCCPPSEADKLAFENADVPTLVRALFDGMGDDIESFDDEPNPDDPWKFFSGVCLTLSAFTITSPGDVPISNVMDGIVRGGTRRNGRTRNGFFFSDGEVYHEMSPLSWAGAGSITWQVLGYDSSGEDPGSPRKGHKRVVELPWQLAPHGEAIYTELVTTPEDYGPEDKIAYRLVGPYMGDVLVKATCCTAEELDTYEDVSEGALGFLTRPLPPVIYTSTAEQCEQMEPAYTRA